MAVVLVLMSASYVLAWQGKVVGITDGDTIKVLDSDKQVHKIRLYGIDCPEKGQPFGTKAKQKASDLAFQKTVKIQEFDTDRYGRTIADVILPDGRNMNLEMIRSGFAWVYTKYCKRPGCREWKDIEESARQGRVGLWSDPHTTPPWEWRRKK